MNENLLTTSTLLSEDSTVAEVLAVFESEGLALSSLRVHRPPSAQLIAFADGEVARFPAPSAVVCATWVGDAAAGAAACGGKGSVSRLFLDAASKPALAAAWSQPAESPATAKDTAVVLADSLAEARPVLVFRRPSLYAAERVASGKSVPNFLLPAGAPGHLPPHVALSRLEAEFAALPPYETVAAGDDGSSSPSPRTLVNDERDVPPHVRAVRLLEEIEARRAQSGVVVDGEGEAKVVKVKRALGACWRVTTAVLAVAKFVFSTVITIGAIALIYIAIGSNLQALPPHEVWAPVIHIPLLLFVITALAYLEGIQVAILELKHVDRSRFEATRPRAARNHALLVARDGKNVERFLVGRQFCVVFVVFLCAQLTTFPTLKMWSTGDDEKSFFSIFTYIVKLVIIDTGFPGVLYILSFGQLMPQLIASKFPVFFMNIPGVGLVSRVALFLESVGVTHFSWLLAAVVEKAMCLQDESSLFADDHDVHQDVHNDDTAAGEAKAETTMLESEQEGSNASSSTATPVAITVSERAE